jgi:hypothetical protein
MAITNGTGAGRKTPVVVTGGNHTSAVASLDDDERQKPGQIVGFTTQAMIVANSTTSPYQMIV